MHAKLFFSSVLIASVMVNSSASAESSVPMRTCDQLDGNVCGTGGECYSAYWAEWLPPESTDGVCWQVQADQPGTVQVEFLTVDPPGTPRLVCEPVGNCNFTCNAWPHGSGFSYEWTPSGQIRLEPQPAASDNFAIARMNDNSGGVVSVQVTSPSGTSETAQWEIPAGVCFRY